MILIKNPKIFKKGIADKNHWSKLKRLKDVMKTEHLWFPEFVDLTLCDLKNSNLTFAKMKSANLASSDLSCSDLRSIDFSNANLQGADLSYSDLRSADLNSANLRYANLSGCNLGFTNLRSASLNHAILKDATLKDIDCKKVIIKDFMYVTGIGSANRQTLFFDTNIGIVIQCGCFYGDEQSFRKELKETHGDSNYAQEYLLALRLAKVKFSKRLQQEE